MGKCAKAQTAAKTPAHSPSSGTDFPILGAKQGRISGCEAGSKGVRQVNYIAEINLFERWLETNHLPVASQLLWYKLMSLCNRCGWAEWITVDNRRLIFMIQASSEKAAITARHHLLDKGLIEFRKGKKGSPNQYRLCPFQDGALSSHLGGNGHQSGGTTAALAADINKPKEKKEKPVVMQRPSVAVPFEEIQALYNGICANLPKIKRIDGQRRKAVEARFHSYGSLEVFEELFRKAQASTFLQGENARNWHADFDWLITSTNMAKVLEDKYAVSTGKGDSYADHTGNFRKSGGTPIQYGIVL